MDVGINLKHIVIGWGKKLKVLKTNEAETKLSELRMSICHGCTELKDGKFLKIENGHAGFEQAKKCGVCGCPIEQKTIVINEKCPLGKW